MSCSRTRAGRRAVERALVEADLRSEVVAGRDLSGGCIHRVRELELADGTRVVSKTNDADRLGLFEEEALGLEALAETATVLVPRPLAVCATEGVACLLVEALAPGEATAESWPRFGRELAALHAAPVAAGRGYGFAGDNHLGATPQPNGWCDDWVEFNATRRLGHQLALARSRSLLRGDEGRAVQRVIDRLDSLIPRRPRPSLLHGDLWSGNALVTRGGRVAVIDPACSVGDGWADIAMMRLFGGFSEGCFEAYASSVDDREGAGRRVAVYQLYHLLNHVNLFGRGYVAQAMAVARGVAPA